MRARIIRLEQSRPSHAADVLDLSRLDDAALQAMADAYGATLDCPANFNAALLSRLTNAKAAGTFPQSLCDADLMAIVQANDAARVQP